MVNGQTRFSSEKINCLFPERFHRLPLQALQQEGDDGRGRTLACIKVKFNILDFLKKNFLGKYWKCAILNFLGFTWVRGGARDQDENEENRFAIRHPRPLGEN